MTWPRRVALVLAVFVLGLNVSLAEKVADLPAPTGYVSDLAGVLDPSTKQNLEDLCKQVDTLAHAQIAVVTIKTLDDNEPIEDFTTALEEKWKVGAKGTDKGVLMLFVMNPRHGRIEVGYGLEGILNDAKVGDIGRTMVPYAQTNDYNHAIPLGVQQVAQVIAKDAGVTLTTSQPVHQYHRENAQQPIHLSLLQVLIVGGILLVILVLLIKTGNVGLIFFLLGNLMGGGGGGRGGGGGGDDDRGGGFGGFGGGSSGGGGASGDW